MALCLVIYKKDQLHTLEDFSAHSNFCELSLVAMGHHDVFVHVGDRVRIQAKNGKWVAPLVTGEFPFRSVGAILTYFVAARDFWRQ